MHILRYVQHNLTGNLDTVTGFIQKNQYPAPMNALRSEWGAIGNLRFLISSIGSITPNASSLGAIRIQHLLCWYGSICMYRARWI